ncbi:MAG: DUF4105 domain-containing protein [Oceanococcus sp.]
MKTAVFTLLACLIALPLWAAEDDLIVERLAQSSQWQALLHWDAGSSRVDSANFFVHPQGKSNALKELRATQQALLANPAMRCRFPARLQFLGTHFADIAALSLASCTQYQQWRDRLNPQTVTLVFAAAYLGNPSSLFGHTFLRLDDGSHPLLAWAVNFAAQTQDAKSLNFAWKGMTGGYPGRFGLAPYYDKVTEYARLEQRDLWEYRLALDAADIELLLAHLWEMRDSHFEYYFFQENCSFQLLALLHVLRPELSLTQGFSLFAAPVDTLRRLQQYGLVQGLVHRPAQQIELRAKIAGLSSSARERLSLQLSQPQSRLALDALQSPTERALWLEALAGLAQSRQADSAQEADWQSLQDWALKQRSRLNLIANEPQRISSVSPDQAHLSQRASLTWHYQSATEHAAEASWRPVLHDALDGARGLPAGSEIAVLNTRLRWQDAVLKLQQLQFFDVRALPLRDTWFSPMSWQLGVGYARDEWSQLGYWRGLAAIGGSWRVPLLPAAQTSVLLRGSLLLGKSGQRALESALEWSVQGHWGADWPWHFGFEWLRRDGRIIDDALPQAVLSLGQQWQLSPRFALRLTGQQHFSSRQRVVSLTVAHYF